MLLRPWIAAAATVGWLAWFAGTGVAPSSPMPQALGLTNVLVAIADDWSFPHAGVYGDRAVRTPTVDRLAREGALFTHAFAATPSCTASRAALLTGQHPHRLAEGAMLWGFLPARFPTYPDLLERAGYHVGFTRKGWGPGRLEPGGRTRNPAGPSFSDLDAFLAARPEGRPFAFWFGSQDPHRPYEAGSGAKAGIDLAAITVPAFLPDTPDVRHDLADYLAEVERFDRDLGAIIARLERLGELDRTLVIVTADNGMPFPRAKANLYDGGTRVPLVMRWPGRVKAGLRSDALVTLTDLAATILQGTGVGVPEGLTSRSLLAVMADRSTAVHDAVLLERERHANVRAGHGSYPVRAIRTRDFLYVRNLRPDRWPAGDPETWFAVGPFGDIDGGPSKSLLLDRRADPVLGRFFALATAKRPADELYDVRTDPGQLVNLVDDPQRRRDRDRLREQLDRLRRQTGDPRLASDDDRWDEYPYYGGPAAAEPAVPPRPARQQP